MTLAPLARVIDEFLVIVGLPRSGTTLLTALLDAHPRICLFYEPWNSSSPRPAVPSDVEEFRTAMLGRFGLRVREPVHVTGFKETSIEPGSIGWAASVADSIARSCRVHVIWIHRDPIHCVLSKLEAARKWWGWPNAHLTRDTLIDELRQLTPRFQELHELASKHGGVVVPYESLVQDPAAVLSQLLGAIGEHFLPAQLDYYRAGPQPKVMGDVEVAERPAAVSVDSALARAAEAEAHRELIASVWTSPEFSRLREESRAILSGKRGVASSPGPVR